MREFSLCSGILSQVAKANPSGLSRVAVITIEVGELAGVDLDSLCFWFPMVVESAERHTYSLRCNIKPGARAAMPAVASLRCMIFISLAHSAGYMVIIKFAPAANCWSNLISSNKRSESPQ